MADQKFGCKSQLASYRSETQMSWCRTRSLLFLAWLRGRSSGSRRTSHRGEGLNLGLGVFFQTCILYKGQKVSIKPLYIAQVKVRLGGEDRLRERELKVITRNQKSQSLVALEKPPLRYSRRLRLGLLLSKLSCLLKRSIWSKKCIYTLIANYKRSKQGNEKSKEPINNLQGK